MSEITILNFDVPEFPQAVYNVKIYTDGFTINDGDIQFLKEGDNQKIVDDIVNLKIPPSLDEADKEVHINWKKYGYPFVESKVTFHEDAYLIDTYKDGFTIDRSVFYSFDNKENVQIIDDVRAGKVPPKYRRKGVRTSITVFEHDTSYDILKSKIETTPSKRKLSPSQSKEYYSSSNVDFNLSISDILGGLDHEEDAQEDANQTPKRGLFSLGVKSSFEHSVTKDLSADPSTRTIDLSIAVDQDKSGDDMIGVNSSLTDYTQPLDGANHDEN
uniref:SEP domain-containing protein n=1 Tax=Coptotermes formosanus TaxID=36987 RepID=R4ULY6_COPFO|nr:hypothetical protein [Coptotermes formosanus]